MKCCVSVSAKGTSRQLAWKKLATAIAPEPILSIVVFANLTDRGISPIIEQKIWEVKESVAAFKKQ